MLPTPAPAPAPAAAPPPGRWSRRRRAGLAVAAAALIAACGTEGAGSGVGAITPRDGRSGLQLTGTIDGKQVVVNDGAPELRLGDCDVNDGPDTDLCFFSRNLDGGFFAIVIENPAVVVPGSIGVVAPACVSPHCDDVADGVIAEVQLAPGTPRERATGGGLRLTAVEEGRRYAGTMNLELAGGRIGGTFEVVPRPEEPEDESG